MRGKITFLVLRRNLQSRYKVLKFQEEVHRESSQNKVDLWHFKLHFMSSSEY